MHAQTSFSGGLLSVVLPALNEEEGLPLTVARVMDVLRRYGIAYEIIIVDDGSTDGTGVIAAHLAREHRGHIRCVRHERNLGYGAALQAGIRHTKGQRIATLDADNQFDPGDFPRFLGLLDSWDVVTGVRTPRRDDWWRVAFSAVFNACARPFLRIPFRDVNCAFKVFRRVVLDGISLESNHSCFSAEFLMKARHGGFSIAEIPVSHAARKTGKSTVNVSRLLKTLWEILCIRLMLRSPESTRPVHHANDSPPAATPRFTLEKSLSARTDALAEECTAA